MWLSLEANTGSECMWMTWSTKWRFLLSALSSFLWPPGQFPTLSGFNSPLQSLLLPLQPDSLLPRCLPAKGVYYVCMCVCVRSGSAIMLIIKRKQGSTNSN